MRCFKCFRTEKSCFCDEVKPFETRTRFVLLMHPMEFKREKNGTGHLSHMCLKNSEIIVDIDFTNNERVNEIINSHKYDSYVLYPGDYAINLHHQKIENYVEPKKELCVFLIDATWAHAKKMMRLSKNLQALKRISFDNTRISEFFIKQQPDELCLSTLETIHFVIDLLNEQGFEKVTEHNHLMDLFRKMIKFQVDCSLNPELQNYRPRNGYKPLEERRKSKKWESYSLIFKDQKKDPKN